MDELQALEQKHRELGAEIEKLRQKKEQESLPAILWKPEEAMENYSCLGAAAAAEIPKWMKSHNRYIRQQLFKTCEEAERAGRQRIALMRVLRRVAELNHEKGWVCDWDSKAPHGQRKYYPRYDHTSGFSLDYYWSVQMQPTSHYAAEGVWETVISEMEGDVKFGLWGIE